MSNAEGWIKGAGHWIHFSNSLLLCYFPFLSVHQIPSLFSLPTRWNSVDQWKQVEMLKMWMKKPSKALNSTNDSLLVLLFAYTPTQGAFSGMMEFHMNIQLQVAVSKNSVTSKTTFEKGQAPVAPGCFSAWGRWGLEGCSVCKWSKELNNDSESKVEAGPFAKQHGSLSIIGGVLVSALLRFMQWAYKETEVAGKKIEIAGESWKVSEGIFMTNKKSNLNNNWIKMVYSQ